MPDHNQTSANAGAGSPPNGEPVYLVVGKLRRPHGIAGEIMFQIITHFPERIKPGATIWVGKKKTPLSITGRRIHQDGLLLQIKGISTPEEAALWRNQFAYVPAENLPKLGEDEYYHHQLLGLEVWDDDDRLLGTLSDILETGANDVYIVKNETGQESLIPAIESVIQRIDLAAGKIHIHLIPGLLDE